MTQLKKYTQYSKDSLLFGLMDEQIEITYINQKKIQKTEGRMMDFDGLFIKIENNRTITLINIHNIIGISKL